MAPALSTRLLAESLGTGALLTIIVGSGVMAEQLAPADDVAVALLGHSIAVGAGLAVLITALGPISGAHLNPAVTAMFVLRREQSLGDGLAYCAVQCVSALGGVLLAHTMFDQPLVQIAEHPRSSVGLWVAELVATTGLCLVILLTRSAAPERVASAVGLFIASGLWFTASAAFANPAVTLARAFTDTFAGISFAHVGPFVAAQLVAVPLAVVLDRALRPLPEPS